MKQIWSHQTIIDKNQGSSKEIGYQLKGDLSHMYRFLSRQTIDDIRPQSNLHIWDGSGKREQGIQKEVINIQTRLLLKSIAHSSNLSHRIWMNFKCITHITKGTRDSEDALR